VKVRTLAGDLWDVGLDGLSDDELIGVMRAARRLGSWAAGMELAAIGDLWRRRVADEQAGDDGAAEHADGEIAAALTLTSHAADTVLDLAITQHQTTPIGRMRSCQRTTKYRTAALGKTHGCRRTTQPPQR
jgi:hypothetical protein